MADKARVLSTLALQVLWVQMLFVGAFSCWLVIYSQASVLLFCYQKGRGGGTFLLARHLSLCYLIHRCGDHAACWRWLYHALLHLPAGTCFSCHFNSLWHLRAGAYLMKISCQLNILWMCIAFECWARLSARWLCTDWSPVFGTGTPICLLLDTIREWFCGNSVVSALCALCAGEGGPTALQRFDITSHLILHLWGRGKD